MKLQAILNSDLERVIENLAQPIKLDSTTKKNFNQPKKKRKKSHKWL